LEEPAGGGAVVAVQQARLTGQRVSFFTALGRDAIGRQSAERLTALGLDLQVAWRDGPSRRGVSFVDASGERTITVIGDRLTPGAADPLDWRQLADCDGAFITAADVAALKICRQARWLGATPRLRLAVLQAAGIGLDALIGSGLDPGEAALPSPLVDSYGCGDSFAAGVTAGMAAGWTVEQAVSLGCHCGAACAGGLGPYASQLRLAS
jgi:ribokinase